MDNKVCLKIMGVEGGQRQYCEKPSWVEPGRTRPYYIVIPRTISPLRIYLCMQHAFEDAESRYATLWAEVQSLEKDPGLDISEVRMGFQRAAMVLAEKPSRGLLIAANARANAFIEAASLYLEDAQVLIVRYSGVGVEDILRTQERSVQGLLAQAEDLRFRCMNAPRGERPYKEMHDLASNLRIAARSFYRSVVSFPELQQRLIADQERKVREREVREKEGEQRAEQRKLVESTRGRLMALLNFPTTEPKKQPVKAEAPLRKGKKASEPPDPSDNGQLEGEVLDEVDAQA